MKENSGFDQIINHYLNNVGDCDGGNNIISIDICENTDLQRYNNEYSNQKERVNGIISSVVKEKNLELGDNEPLPAGKIVLFNQEDSWASINDSKRLFAPVKMQECILHESSKSFRGDDTMCHYFIIRDNNVTKLKSLTVTAVFGGTFDGPRYNPGKLTVELMHLSSASDLPVSIGNAPDDLQIPNTANEIGRVVLQHESKGSVIDGGLFEVSVTADANTSYSLSIGGSFARPLLEETKREAACLLAKRDAIAECAHRSALLRKKSTLLERKKAIENELVEEARGKCVRTEVEMQTLDLELDDQDEMEDGGASIVRRIDDLKLEKIESYRLFSLRSKLNDGLSSEMKCVAEERELLRQRAQRLEEEIESGKSMLSKLATTLWGDRTSKLTMRQLESNNGGNDG